MIMAHTAPRMITRRIRLSKTPRCDATRGTNPSEMKRPHPTTRFNLMGELMDWGGLAMLQRYWAIAQTHYTQMSFYGSMEIDHVALAVTHDNRTIIPLMFCCSAHLGPGTLLLRRSARTRMPGPRAQVR